MGKEEGVGVLSLLCQRGLAVCASRGVGWGGWLGREEERSKVGGIAPLAMHQHHYPTPRPVISGVEGRVEGREV